MPAPTSFAHSRGIPDDAAARQADAAYEVPQEADGGGAAGTPGTVTGVPTCNGALVAFFTVSTHPEVSTLVERCGYAVAALTILPIPGSEILGVMPLHVGMVIGIGHYHGHELTQESAMELVMQIGATVGVSLVGSKIATTAAKFILPGLGGVIAAPFMFASTLALGAVADTWFQRGGAVSEAEMKAVYDRVVRGAKSEFRPDKMKDDEALAKAKAAVDAGKADPPPPAPEEDAVARLKRAKELLEAGLLDQAEYDAIKKRILDTL